jgi:hypothetical protein
MTVPPTERSTAQPRWARIGGNEISRVVIAWPSGQEPARCKGKRPALNPNPEPVDPVERLGCLGRCHCTHSRLSVV